MSRFDQDRVVNHFRLQGMARAGGLVGLAFAFLAVVGAEPVTSQIATRPLPIKMDGNHRAFEVFFDTFLRKGLEGDRSYLTTLIRAQLIEGLPADQAAQQWHQWLRSGRLIQPVKYRCQGMRKCEIEVRMAQWIQPFRVSFVRDSASTGWIAESFRAPVSRPAADRPSPGADVSASAEAETLSDPAMSPDQSAHR